MKRYNLNVVAVLASTLLLSCGRNEKSYDASGTFEVEETIISAQANGELIQFQIEEGDVLDSGAYVGAIDSLQLHLKRAQLNAQIDAVLGMKPDVGKQLAGIQEQLKTAQKERKRVQALVDGNVATQKQLDDMDAQIELLNKQLDAQRTTLLSGVRSTDGNAQALEAQLAQLNDQIRRCHLINPVKGTVLLKYTREHEMTAIGKPLYKLADLSVLTLRAYVSGDQLPKVKINQKVTVKTDDGNGEMKNYDGTIYWVSEEAEFTPKTVQTKDERANRVYAVKIRVKNDGYLKSGMYGEINF